MILEIVLPVRCVEMSLLGIPRIVMSTKHIPLREDEESSEGALKNSLGIKNCGFYRSSPEIRCWPSPCLFDYEGNRAKGTA